MVSSLTADKHLNAPLAPKVLAGQAPLAHYEQATPMLLSQQPVRLNKSLFDQESPNWSDIYSHLEGRLGTLRTWRYTWWEHWSACARWLLPYRYKWLVTANNMNRGRPLNDRIIDSTGVLAMKVCAHGLLSGLMSPSRPWFRLGIDRPGFELDHDAQVWLDEVESRIYTILAGSNVYAVMDQAFQDIASFGTAPIILYEDEEDVIRAYVPCCGEYYLDVSPRQEVDTFYREFTFNVYQIVSFFGLKNCPESVRKLWEAGGGAWENEFVVRHAIEPNTALSDKKGGQFRVVPKHFAFRELYWLRDGKTLRELSRRGFAEKPFFCARWSVSSNDAYGRGPGMDALGDLGALQQAQREKAEFEQKAVRPPMVGPVELENKPASILPGNITFVSTAGVRFEPAYLVNPAMLEPLIQDIKEIQQRIKEAFFTPTFQLISQMEGVQPRNELELSMRQGEKIEQLGPVIELFEHEVASPMLERIVSIMERRRLLPPAPRSLHGLPLKFTYISMMKVAQRAAETASMERYAAFAAKVGEGSAAGTLPGIRVVDHDELVRQYADALGVKANVVRSREKVEELEKQQVAQQQNAQAWQKGMAGIQGLEGLSRVDVGGGQNAVSAMMGNPPNESPGG